MSLQQLCEALQDMELIDLGQYMEENMPVHPSHSRFYKTRWHGIALNDICNDYQLIFNEHNGTHVDSFGHYINKPGYEMIDEISLEKFSGPCVTIDATFLKAGETLEKDHVLQWEKTHGEIQCGEIVLIDFGWMQYWDLRPNDYKFCHDFPGVGKSAADYFVEKKVKMVGVDTLSVDKDKPDNDPAHYALLGNKIPVTENLCNLGLLHDKKGYFVMLPLLIREGSASPVRPVVVIEKN